MSSISSMEREISRCEAKIEKNNEEIQKLEKRNEELRQIKKKFEDTGEKLYDYNKRRNNTYEELRYTLRNTKFVVQNADTMLEYINGSYYKKAGDGVAESIKKIEQTIQKNEDRIEELKRRNNELRNRISHLREEIRRERRKKHKKS